MSKQDKKSNKSVKDKRQGVLKLYSVGTTVILVVILVVFNILFENILGNYLKFDFSLSGQNAVQQSTIDYLNSLPDSTNIRIVGLFEKPESIANGPYQFMVPLLDSFVKEGKGKISVEYVDPTKYPSIITELDPKGVYDLQSDTYAVSDGNRVITVDPYYCFTYDDDYYQQTGYTKPLTNNVEYTFDNAIYQLTSGTKAKAYFITGLLNDNSLLLKTLLSNMGIESADIAASENATIPDDCDILFLNCPESDLPEGMVSAIKDYLFNRGGKLVAAVGYTTTNQSVKFNNLNSILEYYNIALGDSLVLEYNPSYQINSYTNYSLLDVASEYATFVNANARLRCFNARAVKPLNNPSSSIINKAVLTTSNNAVEEGDITNSVSAFNIGMFGTYDNADASQVYVFGTTYLTSDSYINQYGMNDSNVQFVRNCIRDMLNLPSGIQVESKAIDDYSIRTSVLTSTNTTIMTVVFMIVVPLGLVIAATVVYKLRKNL